MRPRVFPAEDLRPRGDDLSGGHASMRPRVFPAEDNLFIVRDNAGNLVLQ